jgi:hypothetical protein
MMEIAMAKTNLLDTPIRHAHCSFCGGKGPDLQAELVISPIGVHYRVPLSHTSCKESILSLSLSLDKNERCSGEIN